MVLMEPSPTTAFEEHRWWLPLWVALMHLSCGLELASSQAAGWAKRVGGW